MKIFSGTVTSGYGLAGRNLDLVMGLIEARTSLANLVRGTLNVNIPEEYIVLPDAVISPDEYPSNKQANTRETIKIPVLPGCRLPSQRQLSDCPRRRHLASIDQSLFGLHLGPEVAGS